MVLEDDPRKTFWSKGFDSLWADDGRATDLPPNGAYYHIADQGLNISMFIRCSTWGRCMTDFVKTSQIVGH